MWNSQTVLILHYNVNYIFVVAYKLIAFHPLHSKLKNGTGYVYKHCQVFFVMYYQPQGSHPTVTRFLKRVFESKPTALGYTLPRYVSKVLCYLGTIYNSEDLSLWNVTLKNCNGCICPKRPNYWLLYRNLDDKISSETLITFTLRKPLKQSKTEVKAMLVKFTS